MEILTIVLLLLIAAGVTYLCISQSKPHPENIKTKFELENQFKLMNSEINLSVESLNS